MKVLITILLSLTSLYVGAEMKVKVSLDSGVYSATLADNPTSQSFWQKLPLESKLDNYAHNEKVVYMNDKLSIENASAAYTGKAGDITYYAPWGNIAMFLDKGPYAPGLICMGKFDGDLTALSRSTNIKFEREE
ncbi:cyclophilin-like fold protein [Rodentibacter caecimuris]|uniref:cyclophilin-like fold protein n=1 Tax=Rodentibacter caecimuris TaxID=1796644 RepID=UPI00258A908D|nr:cyclophilin-like fold protein [Rodentibacter heylii]